MRSFVAHVRSSTTPTRHGTISPMTTSSPTRTRLAAAALATTGILAAAAAATITPAITNADPDTTTTTEPAMPDPTSTTTDTTAPADDGHHQADEQTAPPPTTTAPGQPAAPAPNLERATPAAALEPQPTPAPQPPPATTTTTTPAVDWTAVANCLWRPPGAYDGTNQTLWLHLGGTGSPADAPPEERARLARAAVEAGLAGDCAP